MFVLMISQMSLKMGHVGSKTRSLGQILEIHCVASKGHIFSPILIEVVIMFALIKSRTSLKMGYVGSKTR